MDRSSLHRPVTVDIVPATEVSALLEATDREFVQLEQRAASVVAAADAAEADARTAGVDGSSTTWTMVRLQRFLTTLTEEAERDARATVDVARRRAEARVAIAHSAAVDGGGDPLVRATKLVTPTPFVPASPPAVPPTPPPTFTNGETRAASPPQSSPPQSFPPATSSGGGAASARVTTTVLPTRNGSSVPTATLHDVARSAVAAPVAPVVLPPSDTPVPAAPKAMSAPSAFVPVTDRTVAAPLAAPAAPVVAVPVAQPGPDATAAPAPAPALAQAPAAAPAKARRRFPISAILEVVAVLLILLFILLRLS